MIKTLRFLLTWTGMFVFCISAYAASLDVPKDSLWLYLPFEGTLQGYPKERVMNFSFGDNEEEFHKGKGGASPNFVPGKSGKGLDLSPNRLLNYLLDTSDFPVEKGSLVVWLNPHEDMSPNRENFILEAQWASFELRTSMAYCTSDHKFHMGFDPRKSQVPWKGNWHLYVMTWDGGKRVVYLDGVKVYERDGVPGNKSMSPAWAFGYLPSCPGRAAGGFLNAVIDDFAVLSAPLCQKDVETLWADPSASLFSLMGSAVSVELPRKVFVRGEKIPLTFNWRADADEALVTIIDDSGKTFTLGKLNHKDVSFIIDSNLLRPGKLQIRVEPFKGEVSMGGTSVDIVLHQFRSSEFPIGVGGGINADAKTLDYLKKNHISFMTGNGPPQNFHASLDKWYSRGIAYFPNLNIITLWQNGFAFNRVKEEPYFIFDKDKKSWNVNPQTAREYLQTIVPAGGKTEDGSTSSASPFSDVAFKMMSGVIKQYLDMAGDHPGWQYVSFQDEVPLRFGSHDPLSKYKNAGWKDEWHCFAMTWKGGRREVFLDGKLVASSDGVPGLKNISQGWALGYLPGCPGRKDGGFANSVFDDFAVVSKALGKEDISKIWAGRGESFPEIAGKISLAESQIWAYWSFDGTIDPVPGKRALKSAVFRGKGTEADAVDKLLEDVSYVDGKSGKGIDLTSNVGLNYLLDTAGFPLDDGSLIFWFKPHDTLDKMKAAYPYFVAVNWAGFSVSLGMSYCTSDNGKFVKWPEVIPSFGDYSYPAIRHFEKVTGMKGPVWPVDKPEGTVFPDDEPYLKWKNTIGLVGDPTGEGFDRLYQRLAALMKEKRPDIMATNYSGGEYGYLDAVADWQYPYIWEPRLTWGGSGHGLLDFCFDRHRARQKGSERKPLWGLLGWWSVDMSKSGSDWWVKDFRLNTEIALAKGVKMLEWFAPGDKGNEGYLGTPEGRAEFEQWCAWLYENGPVLAHLEPAAKGKVAVLLSEINTAGKTRRSPNYPVPYDISFTALGIAGAEPVLVSDDTVINGKLDGFSGLVLLDNDYSAVGVWKKVNDFASTPGKTVFHDSLSALYPEKSVPLGFSFCDRGPKGALSPLGYLNGLSFQADAFRKHLSGNLLSARCKLSGSDFVASYWLEGGSADYLFLVNYNWKEPQKVNLSVSNPYGGSAVLYNFLTRREVPFESPFEIGPADWAVMVLLPQKIGGIHAEITSTGKYSISVDAGLKGADGKSLAAAVPLSVKVFSPDGEEMPYVQPTSFNVNGEWKRTIGFSELMDKAGTYRMEFHELLSGKKTFVSFNIGK